MSEPLRLLGGIGRGTYRAVRYWVTHLFTFKDLRDALPMILLMALFLVLVKCSHEAARWAQEFYRVPTDSAGSEPPWWFIRRDYLEGLCNIPGILVSLAVYLIVARWSKAGGRLFFFMSLIFLGPMACRALVIWCKCSHILEPELATAPWRTFVQYREDAWIMLSLLIPIFSALAFSFALNYRDTFKKDAEASQPPVDV